MPKNEHQRQKKQMKKRRKQKERKQTTALSQRSSSERSLIKRSQKFPLVECLINSGWETDSQGLNRIVITRQQPDGLLVFGSFLIDMYLLGVKDAHSTANIAASTVPDMLQYVYPDVDPEPCDIGLAHQMIYQAIDYAAKYEMKPHKDFLLAKHILDPRGTHPETHSLTFGKNGKPLFVAGPYDNEKTILRKLDRTAGPGNYNYAIDRFDLFDDVADYDDYEDEDNYEGADNDKDKD